MKATPIPISSDHASSRVGYTFAPMQQSDNDVTFYTLRMIPRYLRLDAWAGEQRETLREEIKRWWEYSSAVASAKTEGENN